MILIGAPRQGKLRGNSIFASVLQKEADAMAYNVQVGYNKPRREESVGIDDIPIRGEYVNIPLLPYQTSLTGRYA